MHIGKFDGFRCKQLLYKNFETIRRETSDGLP